MSIAATPTSTTADDVRQASAQVLLIGEEATYSEWRAMFDAAGQANPFQHPDYVAAELNGIKFSGKLQPVVIRVGTATRCDGLGVLIPKTINTSKVGGMGPSWSLHGYRLAGGSFILRHDATVELEAQLLAAVNRHVLAVGAEFLLLEDIDEESSLSKIVQSEISQGFRQFPFREIQTRWRIEFPEVEDDYWKTFTSRTRSKFRARLKKFGNSRLERITHVEQVPEFLRAANEISQQSWQSRQFGLRIRNDESELQKMSVLAQQGYLRSYLWIVEGKPAAFALCHQRQGYLRYEEIAYCSEYSLLSPGVTLLQQMIEDFYRSDLPKILDFGGGDAEYKQKFGNRQSHSQSLWLLPPTWRTRVTLTYLSLGRRLRSCARTLVKTVGFATRARQWLRYGRPPAAATTAATETSTHETESDSPVSSGR